MMTGKPMKMKPAKPLLLVAALLRGALALHALAGPGGWDQTYAPTVTGAVNGVTRTRVARLNSNGTVDGSFLPTNKVIESTL